LGGYGGLAWFRWVFPTPWGGLIYKGFSDNLLK
jgi:hypothetical protein